MPRHDPDRHPIVDHRTMIDVVSEHLTGELLHGRVLDRRDHLGDHDVTRSRRPGRLTRV